MLEELELRRLRPCRMVWMAFDQTADSLAPPQCKEPAFHKGKSWNSLHSQVGIQWKFKTVLWWVCKVRGAAQFALTLGEAMALENL